MSKHIHNINYFKQVRVELRKNSTLEEKILWSKLRGKNLEYKFKRQHSIGNSIADFFCAQKRLIIELDGNQHLDNKEYDQERTNYFESLGIKVIRFWNYQITENIDGVVNEIRKELDGMV